MRGLLHLTLVSFHPMPVYGRLAFEDDHAQQADLDLLLLVVVVGKDGHQDGGHLGLSQEQSVCDQVLGLLLDSHAVVDPELVGADVVKVAQVVIQLLLATQPGVAKVAVMAPELLLCSCVIIGFAFRRLSVSLLFFLFFDVNVVGSVFRVSRF